MNLKILLHWYDQQLTPKHSNEWYGFHQNLRIRKPLGIHPKLVIFPDNVQFRQFVPVGIGSLSLPFFFVLTDKQFFL